MVGMMLRMRMKGICVYTRDDNCWRMELCGNMKDSWNIMIHVARCALRFEYDLQFVVRFSSCPITHLISDQMSTCPTILQSVLYEDIEVYDPDRDPVGLLSDSCRGYPSILRKWNY